MPSRHWYHVRGGVRIRPRRAVGAMWDIAPCGLRPPSGRLSGDVQRYRSDGAVRGGRRAAPATPITATIVVDARASGSPLPSSSASASPWPSPAPTPRRPGNSAIDAAYRAGIMAATIVAGARARRRCPADRRRAGGDRLRRLDAGARGRRAGAVVRPRLDRSTRPARGRGRWSADRLGRARACRGPCHRRARRALLAAAALVPLWYSGYRVARRSTRRRIRIGLLVGVAVLAVGAIAGAILAATQRSTLPERRRLDGERSPCHQRRRR